MVGDIQQGSGILKLTAVACAAPLHLIMLLLLEAAASRNNKCASIASKLLCVADMRYAERR